MLSPREDATLRAIDARLSDSDPLLAESLRQLRVPRPRPGRPTPLLPPDPAQVPHCRHRRLMTAVLVGTWIAMLALMLLVGTLLGTFESNLERPTAPTESVPADDARNDAPAPVEAPPVR